MTVSGRASDEEESSGVTLGETRSEEADSSGFSGESSSREPRKASRGPIGCCSCCAPCSRAFALLLTFMTFISATIASIGYSYGFILVFFTSLASLACWVWTTLELRRGGRGRRALPAYVLATVLNVPGMLAVKVLTWIYFFALSEPANVANFDPSAHLLCSLFLVIVPLVYFVAVAVDISLTVMAFRHQKPKVELDRIGGLEHM